MAINITRIREKLISKLPASFIFEVVKTAGPGSYLFPLATRLRGYRAEQNPKTVLFLKLQPVSLLPLLILLGKDGSWLER